MTGHELTIGERVALGREAPRGRPLSGYAMATRSRTVYGYRPTCSCGAASEARTKRDAQAWHHQHRRAAP